MFLKLQSTSTTHHLALSPDKPYVLPSNPLHSLQLQMTPRRFFSSAAALPRHRFWMANLNFSNWNYKKNEILSEKIITNKKNFLCIMISNELLFCYSYWYLGKQLVTLTSLKKSLRFLNLVFMRLLFYLCPQVVKDAFPECPEFLKESRTIVAHICKYLPNFHSYFLNIYFS